MDSEGKNKKQERRKRFRRKVLESRTRVQKVIEKRMKAGADLEKNLKLAYDCGTNFAYGQTGISITKLNGMDARFIASRCRNEHICPFCRNLKLRKKEKKSREILERAVLKGYTLVMATFTQPFTRGEMLLELKKKHSRAKQSFKSGRYFQEFKKASGYVGNISAVHLKYNEAFGWNCHTHEIWIIKSEGISAEMQTELSERWIGICKRVGFRVENEGSMMEFGLYFSPRTISPSDVHYLYKLFEEKGLKVNRAERGYDPFSLLSTDIPEREAIFMEYACVGGHQYSTKVELEEMSKSKSTRRWCTRSKEGISESDTESEKTKSQKARPQDKIERRERDYQKLVETESGEEEQTDFSDSPNSSRESSADEMPSEKNPAEEQITLPVPFGWYRNINRNGTVQADILDYVDEHNGKIDSQTWNHYLYEKCMDSGNKNLGEIVSTERKD